MSLTGKFSAIGGSGNDIEVYVLDENGFVNWQNGHSTPTYHNSGRVTQNTVETSLPGDAGTYYIVFSNRFSLLSPQAIEANLKLTFYTG